MNNCTLEMNDVVEAHKGPCDKESWSTSVQRECECRGEEFQPVCSLSGYTYENKCVLNCT